MESSETATISGHAFRLLGLPDPVLGQEVGLAPIERSVLAAYHRDRAAVSSAIGGTVRGRPAAGGDSGDAAAGASGEGRRPPRQRPRQRERETAPRRPRQGKLPQLPRRRRAAPVAARASVVSGRGRRAFPTSLFLAPLLANARGIGGGPYVGGIYQSFAACSGYLIGGDPACFTGWKLFSGIWTRSLGEAGSPESWPRAPRVRGALCARVPRLV